jgi:site-specific DNA recombinase
MSTAKQVSSPARQRDLFLQYCSHHQLQPAGEYEDLATSATHVKLEDRIGIMAMLAAAEHSSFDVVWCEEQSRASRDPLEIIPIQRHLATLGIPIVEHGEDPRQAKVSAERELLTTVRAALSRYEVRQLAARVKRALRLKLEQGEYQGGQLPAGLKWDRQREAFVLDEKTAGLPRRAYELFAETKIIAGTARQLNQEGFRGRRGSPLTHKSVTSLLKQPAYRGLRN